MNKIISKEHFSEKVFKLVIEAPLIAKSRKAGHFVIVRVGEKGERMPLTIAEADPVKGTITLVVQEVGLSSTRLCELNEGDYITDVVGPLDQASYVAGSSNMVSASGGVGVAPMLPIVQASYDTVTFAEMSRSLGDTGLKLPNVSKCQSGQKDEPDYARASMIYDKASDYLVIAAYTDSTMQQSAAMLYGISVADKTLAPLGTFGTGVWPVVGLYRADAASSGNSADAQPVNKTTGSVNAAKLTRTTREDTVKPQSVSGSGSTVANGVMTVTLTEDVAVTRRR